MQTLQTGVVKYNLEKLHSFLVISKCGLVEKRRKKRKNKIKREIGAKARIVSLFFAERELLGR